MSATIATLPRAGNGRTLLGSAAAVLASLFAPKNPAADPAKKELTVWQIYRLTCGYDSISPKVAAELRKKLVG